jgi:hypothetical protein
MNVIVASKLDDFEKTFWNQLELNELLPPWPAGQYEALMYVLAPAHALAANASANATASTRINPLIRISSPAFRVTRPVYWTAR